MHSIYRGARIPVRIDSDSEREDRKKKKRKRQREGSNFSALKKGSKDGWKTAKVVRNSHKKRTKGYKIRDLKADSKYAIRVRGRNGFGWSEFSEVGLGETKQLQLEWLYSKSHGFSKKRSRILSPYRLLFKESSKTMKIFANYTANASDCQIFAWEITVHRATTGYVGFAKGPSRKHAHGSGGSTYLGGNKDEYGLYFTNWARNFTSYSLGGSNKSFNSRSSFTNGDRFIFVCDFKLRNCQVYHNYNNIGKPFLLSPTY